MGATNSVDEDVIPESVLNQPGDARTTSSDRFGRGGWPVALVAAVVAAFADGSPTGLSLWDVALKAVLALAFVLAVAKAPRWVAVVVATIAAAVVGTTIWLLPAALGLAAGVAALMMPTWPPSIRAISGALSIQALVRLPSFGFFGLPSLVAGAAIVLALVAAYLASGPGLRRWVRRGVFAVTALVAVVSIAGGLTLLGARSDVERGIAAARDGLSAARGGEPEAVVAQLEIAADSLSSAEQSAGGLLAQPLRLVPIAAQHRNAVVVATGQGSMIARQASRATISADISSISMSAGSVDLSALVAMEPDLAETVALLEDGVAELDHALSPWLLSPVSSRMASLTDEMRAVLPEARIAADAAKVVPGLLGHDAPRRYFVAFGSPAEARELGGFIGSSDFRWVEGRE